MDTRWWLRWLWKPEARKKQWWVSASFSRSSSVVFLEVWVIPGKLSWPLLLKLYDRRDRDMVGCVWTSVSTTYRGLIRWFGFVRRLSIRLKRTIWCHSTWLWKGKKSIERSLGEQTMLKRRLIYAKLRRTSRQRKVKSGKPDIYAGVEICKRWHRHCSYMSVPSFPQKTRIIVWLWETMFM